MWCRPCPPPLASLPISTGNVGIDPRGQVQVYAAPRVVHAKATCWREWPVPAQWWPGRRGGYGGFADKLARIMTRGC